MKFKKIIITLVVIFGLMVLTAPNEEKHLLRIDNESTDAISRNNTESVLAAEKSIKDNLLYEDYFLFTRSYVILENNKIYLTFGVFGKVFLINKLY